MRRPFGVIWWAAVGMLAIIGVYLSVFGNLPPYLLLVALAMSTFGAWKPGFRYSWAALIGFGALPALLLSSSLLEQMVRTDWSCSQISFSANEGYGYIDSSGEEVLCATIPGQLFLASAVFLPVRARYSVRWVSVRSSC